MKQIFPTFPYLQKFIQFILYIIIAKCSETSLWIRNLFQKPPVQIGDKIQVGINEQNHIAKKGIVSTDTFKSYLP